MGFNTVVTSIAAILIMLLLLEIQQVLTFDDRVPVKFSRVEVLNSPIRPGQNLETRIWREKYRDDCPVWSARKAVNLATGVPYSLPDGFSAGGESGTDYLNFTYPTIDNMPAGIYELHVDLGYFCPGITFPIKQPVATFIVEESTVD